MTPQKEHDSFPVLEHKEMYIYIFPDKQNNCFKDAQVNYKRT